jgi:hypothetical protein
MALFKELKQLQTEYESWQKHIPVNNMGKWAKQVRLENLKKKIDKIEKELVSKKNKSN